MKVEIKVKGCPYEDRESLKTFFHAQDWESVVTEITDYLRELSNGDSRFTSSDLALIDEIRERVRNIMIDNGVSLI